MKKTITMSLDEYNEVKDLHKENESIREQLAKHTVVYEEVVHQFITGQVYRTVKCQYFGKDKVISKLKNIINVQHDRNIWQRIFNKKVK